MNQNGTIKQNRPFIVFGKPDITEIEEKAVLDVLKSGWLGNGPVSRLLENRFSRHFSCQDGKELFSVAVNSCTTGLMLSLKSENIGPGDEVITTPLTFAATANAILSVGAVPVFVDVDETGCIDPNLIEEAITYKTMAIVPVHLGGQPCRMAPIMRLAHMYGLTVIEDAAHSFGGFYKTVPQGTIGDYGVFSFYPTKNLASGDGGMVITPWRRHAERIKMMASQGLSQGAWMRYGVGPIKEYEITEPGMKGLISDLHASIVAAQLSRWDEIKEKRSKVWSVYENAFGKKGEGHSQHLYTIQVSNRKQFRQKMHDLGIGTGIHYNPLHLEPAYSFLDHQVGDFPVAERIGERTVSLPISSTMTTEDAEHVVHAVKLAKDE